MRYSALNNAVTLKSCLEVVEGSRSKIPNRPYMASYWSAIVSIALSCAIFELFNVEYVATAAGFETGASVATGDGFGLGAGRGSLSPTSSVADLRANRDAAVDKFSVSISSFLLNVKMGSWERPLQDAPG